MLSWLNCRVVRTGNQLRLRECILDSISQLGWVERGSDLCDFGDDCFVEMGLGVFGTFGRGKRSAASGVEVVW